MPLWVTQKQGAKIINGCVKAFAFNGNKISAVLLDDGSSLPCDSVAICTGGLSYPATGSTGDGYALAKSAGHTVTKIKPSLVPLVSNNNFIPQLQGLSLKNISLKLLKIKNCCTVISAKCCLLILASAVL